MTNDRNQKHEEIYFEIELIKIMAVNPSDEVASELITLFVKHKVKGTKISKELKDYINIYFLDLDNASLAEKILAVVNKIGRPLYEHKHIAMNVSTWESVLSGLEISRAYEETAKIFNTDIERTRQAFERKNHDFGKKELCRIGLDVFIIMNDYNFSSEDEKKVSIILNEPISEQIHKDEMHLKNKYKHLLIKICKEKY